MKMALAHTVCKCIFIVKGEECNFYTERTSHVVLTSPHSISKHLNSIIPSKMASKMYGTIRKLSFSAFLNHFHD